VTQAVPENLARPCPSSVEPNKTPRLGTNTTCHLNLNSTMVVNIFPFAVNNRNADRFLFFSVDPAPINRGPRAPKPVCPRCIHYNNAKSPSCSLHPLLAHMSPQYIIERRMMESLPLILLLLPLDSYVFSHR